MSSSGVDASCGSCGALSARMSQCPMALPPTIALEAPGARYNVRSRERRLRQHGSVRYEHVSAEDAPGSWRIRSPCTLAAGRDSGRARILFAQPGSSLLPRQRSAGDSGRIRRPGGAQGQRSSDCLGHWLPARRRVWLLPASVASRLPPVRSKHTSFSRTCWNTRPIRGARRFDFMLGDEPYKASWATGQDHVHTVIAARPDPAGRLWLLRRRAYHALKERVRSSARLMSLHRHGLSAIRHSVSQ